MGVVTTSVTPTVHYTPYTGLPARVRSGSSIPRAQLKVVAGDTVWPNAGVGNNARLQIAHLLDRDYAYSLSSIFMSIIDFQENHVLAIDNLARVMVTASADDYYETTMTCHPDWSDTATATEIGAITWPKATSMGYNGTEKIYSLDKTEDVLIFPFQGSGSIPSIVVRVEDPIIAGNQKELRRFQMTLIQYDLDQAYNYMVNMPNLTR